MFIEPPSDSYMVDSSKTIGFSRGFHLYLLHPLHVILYFSEVICELPRQYQASDLHVKSDLRMPVVPETEAAEEQEAGGPDAISFR